MGGYAALKISKIFNANTVILISPLIGDVYDKNISYPSEYYICKEDICGEVFLLYDDKANRDNKNFEFLNNLYAINAYKLSYAGHISYYALKELNLIEILFMGRGEVDLTKFFVSKEKLIFDKNSEKSVTVFCNRFSLLDEDKKNKLLKSMVYNEMKISNYRSDKFNEILALYSNNKEDNLYIEALKKEKENKKEEAKLLYEEALKLNPNQIYWNFMLARLYQNKKDYNNAKKYYEIALDLALGDSVYSVFVSDWSKRLGIVYEKLNNRNETRKYYGLGLSYDLERTENHEFRFNLNANDFEETRRIIQFTSDILPLCKSKIKNNSHQIENSKSVFVYWGQGFDNSPNVVKSCLNSIKINSTNLDLVILDDSNISQYVEIPEFIRKKFETGEMKHAHYSDVLRLLY